MPNPISIFINKVRKFFPADFQEFVSGFKRQYPKLKTADSSEDGMIYGFLPKDTVAQFKYDPEDYILYTDLSQTQVYQIQRKGKK